MSSRQQEKAKKALKKNKQIKDFTREDLDATKLLYEQEDAGSLEAEGPRERTFFMTQEKLKPLVSEQSANKIFSLKIPGPVCLDYTASGRYMLTGSATGQFSMFDWQAGRLGCEVDLRATGERSEKVRDVCFLQNETMFAVAQANYVYIYDNRGIELHRLKKHTNVSTLAYLPYHFILASLSDDRYLRWQDITSGKLAAEFKFPEGVAVATTMAQNPRNAMLHTCHANGVVAMWTPNLNKPAVQMMCHLGPVRAVAVSAGGDAMATAGMDGNVKVWDIRSTYRPVGQYRSMRPAVSLAFSQRDLLAVGFGHHVAIWKDVVVNATPTDRQQPDKPYMRHVVEGHAVADLRFCPFEDVLGIGHSGGIDSVVIPGAGEPNYDVYEAHPFANKRQRQEREVHALLDKLPVETITLDGGKFIGRVYRPAKDDIAAERSLMRRANRKSNDDNDGNYGEEEPKEGDETDEREKRRARGKSSSMRRYLRKRANVIDKYKMEAAEKARLEKIERTEQEIVGAGKEQNKALSRFVSRTI